ncbi:MAG: phenylacetic acid degradation protein [Herminiimonas sp.]|nr:phenylacetic acid degradation protein [Herminiimonas sp.]MDB5853241.1 phenylacetic acid degradation protein [Herminiimonas sp.]
MPASVNPNLTPAHYNSFQKGALPDLLGVEVLSVDDSGVQARLAVLKHHLAPNGYLHAATVVMLADTCAGYGCLAFLPEGAKGFTTIELKSNHLGTALDGDIECKATPVHLGRTTQVWDSIVTAKGKTIALFRCTQMILWAR